MQPATVEYLQDDRSPIHTAVSSNLTIERAVQLKRNAFNAQVMFSNLGRIPFDSNFGLLKLETLWAPCALRGIEGEQTLGAVSVNGSLHLTHTSPAPIPGLLEGMEEELRKACAIPRKGNLLPK